MANWWVGSEERTTASIESGARRNGTEIKSDGNGNIGVPVTGLAVEAGRGRGTEKETRIETEEGGGAVMIARAAMTEEDRTADVLVTPFWLICGTWKSSPDFFLDSIFCMSYDFYDFIIFG